MTMSDDKNSNRRFDQSHCVQLIDYHEVFEFFTEKKSSLPIANTFHRTLVIQQL